MSSDASSTNVARIDLSAWKGLPVVFIALGGIGAVIAAALNIQSFAFSWLFAYMFFLSLCIGCWFLAMAHHLFDASWSVPIRRFVEHGACLLGTVMAVLFIPTAILAFKLYPWLDGAAQAHPDHALKAKFPLFTPVGYYVAAACCLLIWWFIPNRLRYWSLKQDETGSAECTFQMRFYSCIGIVLFAVTVTLASIMWIAGLMQEWYSTMFGVWYFAESVWTTLPTVYVIALLLQRSSVLGKLIKEKTYYMLGSIFLAFTVFWAYVSFAQYFIIWNANMPDETFWYVLREKGTWDIMGKYIIIFGHFFVPFLMLLRIDFKLKLITMIPLAIWAWIMHFCDLQFQIMPALRHNGFLTPGLLGDFACLFLIGGILANRFIAAVGSTALYPKNDPRLAEAMDLYVPPTSHISSAPSRAK